LYSTFSVKESRFYFNFSYIQLVIVTVHFLLQQALLQVGAQVEAQVGPHGIGGGGAGI